MLTVDVGIRTCETPGMDHKRHHWVPKSYLDAWIDPESPASREPYVWVFTKEGKPLDHSATPKLFHKRDLYTIRRSDGQRDLSIETKLLRTIEYNFVAVRDKILQGKSLATQDRLHLCAFAAGMRGRTLPAVKDVASAFQDAKDQIERIATASHRQYGSPDQTDPLASLKDDPLYAEVHRMASAPAVPWVVASLRCHVPVLANMRLAVLHTDDDLGFITSDNPCVLFDPDLATYPMLYRAPQLGSPGAEVTLPLSPRACALFTWSSRDDTRPISPEVALLINRRTCGASDARVVVCRREFRPGWRPND